MSLKNRSLPDLFIFAITIILLAIAYFPSFTGEFIGDDIARITEIDTLGDASIGKILESGLADRPILVLSLWTDRHFFGLSGGMMRLETLLLFGFLALAMRKLVNELSQRFHAEISPWWRDGLILLFCLHPLHSQALTHVCQRGIVLSSLGAILTTYLLVKSNFDWKKLSWRIALLIWMLALLSKPNIAFMPVFWVMLVFSLRFDRKCLFSLIPFFVMLLLPVLNYTVGEFNVQEASQTAEPLNYFLFQGRALLLYAKLIIFPLGLRFNHDMHNPLSPEWWPGIALWISYISLTIWALWQKNNKLFGVFVGGAFLAFLPESSIFPIMHTVFEHRTFFPMVFMTIATVFALRSLSFKLWSTLVIAVMVIVSITLNYKRSLQTQKLSSWAETELSHTCKLEYLQFYLLHRLIVENHYAEARRGLDKISNCTDKEVILPCLEAVYSFSQSPSLDQKSMSTLKACLHSDKAWDKPLRQSINSLVIQKVHSTSNDKQEACLMEDFMSAQLRIFKIFREKYQTEINFYAMSAEKCLSSLSQTSTPEATFQKLKIRTIKRYHFGVPDLTLANDLAKAPDTEDYNYLRSLLETAPKL